MTSPQHLAALALEVWRASGARTEQRRNALLTSYAESYFGVHHRWTPDVHELVTAALLIMRQRTRIDELQYSDGGR